MKLTITPAALALLAAAPQVFAQALPDPQTPEACTAIESDAERLACYDHALGRPDPRLQEQAAREQAAEEGDEPQRGSVFERRTPLVAGADAAKGSLLDTRWELEDASKLGVFNFRAHRPVYLLPVFYTSDTNNRPTSPNPNNTATESQQLDAIETKFQVSFKTKAWEGVFGDTGDLWLGYTQSSRWQVYNAEDSRPFRETNYEPEAILAFRTDYDVLGWRGHLFGVGLNHQSNGRADPLSRSWNRVMFNVGLERDDWVLMLRPWWRISDSPEKDDNPDIEDYVGRGDLQIVHKWNDQEFALLLRHTLRGGDRSRGAAQFDWSFPIAGSLHGYVQVFHGYGESLIDYNHKATYVGAGVSLLEWY